QDMARAIGMVNNINQAELAMVRMSESLRGYLLNPNNKSEYENKKQADSDYGDYSQKIADLTTDSKEISELNKKMMDYDATDLDKIENEVAQLIEDKNPQATKFYIEKYMPARKFQNENFAQLKKLVDAHSAQIISKLDEERVLNARITIASLIVTAIASLIFMFLVLRSVFASIKDVSVHLTEYSKNLGQASAKMTTSSNTLSTSSSEQASALEQTVASLEQITAMIGKTTENARLSAKNSVNSQTKAEEGKAVVFEMLNSMNEINQSNQSIMEQVNKSNAQFSEIVKVIQEIGTKTKVINDIVFQTKLLSFNASVEAARAGEHGKGFSVVAEEVGNLAQMSGNAAKEISAMLNGSVTKVDLIVQDSKQKIEELILSGREKVETGTDVAKRCADVLNNIATNIDSVSNLAGEISTACVEQSTGVSEINKAMNLLDQVTQKNSGVSQESSAVSDEIAEQVRLLNQASGQLLVAISGDNSN
ncbi:MAG: methyl-accepting chemotaxis protein, partial [Pseudobdellovibrio sp.]